MLERRDFIKQLAMTGVGSGLAIYPFNILIRESTLLNQEINLGILGLSPHSAAFSTLLNDEQKESDLAGCRIDALFHPPGNPDVEFSEEQLAGFKASVEEAGVRIVSSMEELLNEVDGVLIETNDGRPHMEQVLPAIKAGKPVFVDKPVAEDLKGVIDIYNLAAEHDVPIFSSSSLRYGTRPQEINQSKKSLVWGRIPLVRRPWSQDTRICIGMEFMAWKCYIRSWEPDVKKYGKSVIRIMATW